MEVNFEEVLATLSLIFGSDKVLKKSDRVILYKKGDNLGYYDVENNIQTETIYSSCLVLPNFIVADAGIGPMKRHLKWEDSSLDTFKVAHLRFINKNFNMEFDHPIAVKTLPKTDDLIIIKDDKTYSIFHKDNINPVAVINATNKDSNINIYGETEYIVISIIEGNRILGVTNDGQFGEVGELLKAKYPDIKFIKHGKSTSYELADGTMLNRLGCRY